MDNVSIRQRELIGRSNRKTAAVEALIQANALNQTGKVNFNVDGEKDGFGFEKVTDKFVDNFLLRILVPDYNVKNGKNIFIGSQNKTI